VIKVFTGYDSREAIGWHVFLESLRLTSTNYVLYPPLSGKQGSGTNAFNTERFRVPEICGWTGKAVFLDGADMILRDDISKLETLFNPKYAVQVVKHDYLTKSPRKYVGTEMESDNPDYPRKNWSSVILWNCAHWAHFRSRDEINEAIQSGDGKYLHRFGWLEDSEIGDLPPAWNVLVGEQPLKDTDKLRHHTLGIPAFKHYAGADGGEWEGMRLLAIRGDKDLA
jgi:hypothetical protein